MNRKQLLTLIGVLAVICLCVTGLIVGGLAYAGNRFGKAIDNAGDPANVQKVASSIADYSLPSGYKQMALDMMIYKYVMLTPDPKGYTDGPFIMLMAYPVNSNMNDEQMQQQMQRAFAQQGGKYAAMEVVDTKTLSIRGKDAKVTIMEGKTSDGTTMRQWLTIFTGKSGPVMLMIHGDTSTWDDKLVNDFVASIK